MFYTFMSETTGQPSVIPSCRAFLHLKEQNTCLWGLGPKALLHSISFEPGYFIALHLGRHYVLGKGKSEQRLGYLVKIVSKGLPVSVSNFWRLSRNQHQCAPHRYYGKEMRKPGRLINTKAVLWISCLKSIQILTYYPLITTNCSLEKEGNVLKSRGKAKS